MAANVPLLGIVENFSLPIHDRINTTLTDTTWQKTFLSTRRRFDP